MQLGVGKQSRTPDQVWKRNRTKISKCQAALRLVLAKETVIVFMEILEHLQRLKLD